MPIPEIIAIDGPAASGKTTIGKLLADKLEYLYLDTGVMYRAITWVALSRGISPSDEAILNVLAKETEIDILSPSQPDGRTCDILANGDDITWDIRKPEVDTNVSQISCYAGVRSALTNQQRRIGLRGRIVMLGRDIGTVVLPEAQLKIYLDASVEERARRRHQENGARGEASSYSDILESMRKRDKIDSSRDLAPLQPAVDAHIIHTDNLDIEEVLEMIFNFINDPSVPNK